MNAIIFDLDDTLYRERRWLLSGFAAVARHLEVAYRLDRRQSRLRENAGSRVTGRESPFGEMGCDRGSTAQVAAVIQEKRPDV